MFDAVCNEITAPMNVDIRATIGMELIPMYWTSSINIFQNMEVLRGFLNTHPIIKKYAPMFRIYFTPIKVIFILSRLADDIPVYL